MKYKLILALIPSVLILLGMGSCKKKTSCVVGNGDFVMDTRTPGNFNRVVANGDFNLTFSQLNETRVDVFAESNILPLIQTTVSNDILVIQLQNNACYSTTQPLEVTLSSPDYKSVTLNGSGTINGNNLKLDVFSYEVSGSGGISSSLDVDDLTVTIDGSGDATLVGTGGTADFSVNGSGTLYASVFTTDTCKVNVTGSGDAHVNASKYLDVTISGSGNVYYKGHPATINSNITGSGSLIDDGK